MQTSNFVFPDPDPDLTKVKQVKSLLKIPSSFLIGSVGLGLQNCKDYDIAMLNSDFDKHGPAFVSKKHDMAKYFGVVPLDNNYLVRYNGIDVLLYEKQERLNALKEVMNKMRKLPVYILEIKNLRIAIFEELLQREPGYIN